MGYAGFDEKWILAHHMNYKRWSEMYEDYKAEHPDCDRPLKYFQHKCNELGLTHRYKSEHDEWIREHYPDLGGRETFKQFCEHFGITKGYEGFKSHVKELGLRVTEERQREADANNGRHDNLPIGTVRSRCRQDFIKVGDGMEGWIPLSHYIAGAPNKGYMVVHLDRDIRNNAPDNLVTIHRRVSSSMAGFDMWSENPTINKTAIMTCELKEVMEGRTI